MRKLVTKFSVGEPITAVVVTDYLLIIALLSGGIKIVNLSVSYIYTCTLCVCMCFNLPLTILYIMTS